MIIQTPQWWGWAHTCVFVLIVIGAHLCFDLSYSRSCIFLFGQLWLKLKAFRVKCIWVKIQERWKVWNEVVSCVDSDVIDWSAGTIK